MAAKKMVKQAGWWRWLRSSCCCSCCCCCDPPGQVHPDDTASDEVHDPQNSKDIASDTVKSVPKTEVKRLRRVKVSSHNISLEPVNEGQVADMQTGGDDTRFNSKSLLNRRRGSFLTPDLSISPELMALCRDQAAINIQRHYRGYRERKMLVEEGRMAWTAHHNMRNKVELELESCQKSVYSDEVVLPDHFISDSFDFSEELGSGNYAVVRRATRKKDGLTLAIKVISKWKLALQSEKQAVLEEVSILRTLNHSNCVALHEVHETQKEVYLCMELISGKDLFDHVSSGEHFEERSATDIIRQVLFGIEYLHQNEIVHRDIKLENIMVDDQQHVKIVDFGLATWCRDSLSFACGTPTYIAPEVITEPVWYATTILRLASNLADSYNEKVDVWATGVVMFIILGGYAPFRTKKDDTDALYQKIRTDEVEFSSEHFSGVSEEGKQLVCLLMEKDPEQRMSARKALCHPWLMGDQLRLGRRKSGFLKDWLGH